MLKTQTKEILALTKQVPAPNEGDIDRAKVAAMTCKSSKDFCEFLELDPLRFNIWCKTYPSYRKAVWAWRDVATSEIEVAMAKRAIGFKKTTRRDVITKTGQVETLINETYYPPDTAAAQFWLKNRAPSDWQDKKEIDVNLNANIRAWLVSAGGQLDPSEIIDGVATEVTNEATNLIANEVQSLIEAELDDGTSERESSMLAECVIEAEANIELEANVASDLNAPTNADPLSAFNNKWR